MGQNEVIAQFFDKLNYFIKSGIKNEWIIIDGFKMYVRKSKRYYKDNFIDCFDIASMESEIKGEGLFTKILVKILNRYPDMNIFVESILNSRLIPFLKRFGFIEYGNDCMILIRNEDI